MPVLILSPNGSITERPSLVVVMNDHPLQPDPLLVNTNKKVLIITTDMTLSDNVVIPFDVEVRFANYAIVTIPSGTTLDMSACQFQKPHYDCFNVIPGGILILPLAGPVTQGFEVAALNATGIVTFGNAINEKQGVDVPSASPAIGSATGNYVNITGVTTIASFGGGTAGMRRILTFTGVLTLTNSINLILPGNKDILTVAGDSAMFVCLASGTWKCVSYQAYINTPGTALEPNPAGHIPKTFTPNQKMVAGTVPADGIVLSGPGFTATSGGAGISNITFNPAFATIPTVVACIKDTTSSQAVISASAITTSGCQIRRYSAVIGNLDAYQFNFIAIGTSL